MASVTPKLRSRKDGAAIPLDDFDKRLLNLMQGALPDRAAALRVGRARRSRCPRSACWPASSELIDERIIRQVTPIFDTRALGYGSMLVAAKVDPEHPWRAAQIINSHPGVSHNYLRNHEFNMWFTLAVEEDSALGLQGTLDVLQELTGAESIRQLPTLKLFKIRMDLEMEGGTDELAKAAVAEEPVELEQAALRRARHGRHPRDPGRPAGRPRAVRAGGRAARDDRRRAASSTCARWSSAACCAASPRSSSTAAPASAPTAWASGRCPTTRIAEVGPRMAAFRGISHCYQRPTYADWPLLDLHDGPRALQGGVRRDPRRDRRREPRDRGPRDALQLDRVQEDPPAVLHRGLQALGTRARSRLMAVSLTDTRSTELYARALQRLPGGVNSPVRAMRAIGRDPIFVERGHGAELVDVDGNRYVDYVCSWGPLILGHAHPAVIAAVVAAAERGHDVRRADRRARSSSPRRSRAACRRSRCCA